MQEYLKKINQNYFFPQITFPFAHTREDKVNYIHNYINYKYLYFVLRQFFIYWMLCELPHTYIYIQSKIIHVQHKIIICLYLSANLLLTNDEIVLKIILYMRVYINLRVQFCCMYVSKSVLYIKKTITAPAVAVWLFIFARSSWVTSKEATLSFFCFFALQWAENEKEIDCCQK